MANVDSSPSSEQAHIPKHLLLLAIAVAVVTLTDVLALAYTARMFDTVFQDRDIEATLEYANPYIGLKELYESGKVNSSKIDPILSRPRISAQVFLDQPSRLAPRGEHDYYSPTWGTMSPQERHTRVTPTVSGSLDESTDGGRSP